MLKSIDKLSDKEVFKLFCDIVGIDAHRNPSKDDGVKSVRTILKRYLELPREYNCGWGCKDTGTYFCSIDQCEVRHPCWCVKGTEAIANDPTLKMYDTNEVRKNDQKRA